LTTDPEARVRFPALPEKKVGLERGPLSLVSTTEELLDRKVATPVYKTESTAVGIRHADHVAISILKKLAITLPTSGSRSVGIVRSRTRTMEFSSVLVYLVMCLRLVKSRQVAWPFRDSMASGAQHRIHSTNILLQYRQALTFWRLNVF
jgi:hypothetical protein